MSSKRVLESAIEDSVTMYAASKEVVSLKLNVRGNNGWPDRIYLFGGKCWFVEFKRKGEHPRALQEHVHSKLRNAGAVVHVIDDIQQGKELIDELTRL